VTRPHSTYPKSGDVGHARGYFDGRCAIPATKSRAELRRDQLRLNDLYGFVKLERQYGFRRGLAQPRSIQLRDPTSRKDGGKWGTRARGQAEAGVDGHQDRQADARAGRVSGRVERGSVEAVLSCQWSIEKLPGRAAFVCRLDDECNRLV
jgi:hypothetical protein